MKKNKEIKKISKKRKIIFTIISFFVFFFLFFMIAELILQLFPIPGIRYDVSKYDSITGGGYYPNSINYYRNDRGDFVKRTVNKWGYYDKNYKKEKEKGCTRIGFFGDSFTQAIQVKLNETFHKLIEDSLSNYHVETLSFGISGFSTFQSYLTYKKWSDFFDLDIIVYVFCENDLGDQIESIKRSSSIPYPILINNKLVVDNSFREERQHKNRFYYRVFNYLTSKSLVIATLSQRVKLLFQHGIKTKVSSKDRFMISKDNIQNEKKHPPNLNGGDVPSLWPDSLKEYAKKLEKYILLEWKKEVQEDGNKFVFIYGPRADDVMEKNIKKDSWKLWLETVCIDNEIPFVDPTNWLKVYYDNGYEVFYDHYTKHGHMALRNAFIDFFLELQAIKL